MLNFIWIALITISVLVGLNFYISSQKEEVAEFEEELKSDPKKRNELFKAMEKSVHGRELASTDPILPTFEELKFLKHINANDPIQVLLGNLLVARSRQARAPLNEEMKAKLKENPAESFKSMKSIFNTLPTNEFPVQKAALIALAIEVNAGKSHEVQELALNHLLTEIPTAAEATNEEVIPTVDLDKVNLSNIAYEAYLINSNDPETALNETFKILELQGNNLVRENIIDNFKQTYPAQGALLEKMVTESKMSDLAHDRQDVEEVEVVEEVKEEGMDN